MNLISKFPFPECENTIYALIKHTFGLSVALFSQRARVPCLEDWGHIFTNHEFGNWSIGCLTPTHRESKKYLSGRVYEFSNVTIWNSRRCIFFTDSWTTQATKVLFKIAYASLTVAIGFNFSRFHQVPVSVRPTPFSIEYTLQNEVSFSWKQTNFFLSYHVVERSPSITGLGKID